MCKGSGCTHDENEVVMWLEREYWMLTGRDTGMAINSQYTLDAYGLEYYKVPLDVKRHMRGDPALTPTFGGPIFMIKTDDREPEYVYRADFEHADREGRPI